MVAPVLTLHWVKDYGALCVAGVAAVAAASNVIITWKTKRNEWVRTERVKRYGNLIAAASAYQKVAMKAIMPAPDAAYAAETQATETSFENALGAVLVLGPRNVARRASLLQPALNEYFDEARAQRGQPEPELNIVNFNRVMNELIIECGKAIGERHPQEEVDYDKWKATTMKPMKRWP